MVLVHRRQNPMNARNGVSAAPRSVGVNWLSAAVGDDYMAYVCFRE